MQIFQRNISDIRKAKKLTQSQVKGFSQVDVSKLERRKDMKISTLVKYVRALGAEIEITAHLSGNKDSKDAEVTILKGPGKRS